MLDYKTARLQTILNLCKMRMLHSKNIKRYITHGLELPSKLIKQIYPSSITKTFSGASLCYYLNNVKFLIQAREKRK